jgi:hypothetical protein
MLLAGIRGNLGVDPRLKHSGVTIWVIRGLRDRRLDFIGLEWAAEHRDELMEDWNRCSQLKPPKAIEPLK